MPPRKKREKYLILAIKQLICRRLVVAIVIVRVGAGCGGGRDLRGGRFPSLLRDINIFYPFLPLLSLSLSLLTHSLVPRQGTYPLMCSLA